MLITHNRCVFSSNVSKKYAYVILVLVSMFIWPLELFNIYSIYYLHIQRLL